MSSHYPQSALKLIICVFLTQICLINSNVIQLLRRSEQNKQTDNNPMDNGLDKNVIKTIEQQLKAQSLEPMDVKLFGYASMIDPRTFAMPYQTYQSADQPYQHPLPHQYNNYQQLYDTMKQSESSMVQQMQHQQQQGGFPSIQEPSQYNVATDEEAMHAIKSYLKKYDLKKYFLKKILGDSYDKEEGHDEGFFGNKHLRRHGTAGMAAKVFGELIGLKIKKTIDHFGDTISDYAKELTTNGFVSFGNSFSKLFRFS